MTPGEWKVTKAGIVERPDGSQVRFNRSTGATDVVGDAELVASAPTTLRKIDALLSTIERIPDIHIAVAIDAAELRGFVDDLKKRARFDETPASS